MSKRAPLSDEKKARLKAASNHHWWRCQQLSRWLGDTPGAVNRHWSCCISVAGVTGEEESPKPGEVAESACNGSDAAILIIKEAYLACLTRNVIRERELLERTAKKIVTRPQDVQQPNLEAQIKIMLWAIRTCGNESTADEAFKMAIERRRNLQQHYY